MPNPYTRAPHMGGAGPAASDSPHAALLIDFDNVTMGMRSDLSKELKTLLASDIIKGKVSVQRAYADWRRYPQYIVPLSEASVDLIFAPAYGSNKKNATDIRMAIDAVELVFIRPEIGTYILLTGDSDFSSLVLKLKEYGKYVIGVGIQESTSDILVQNCDEYYSYTSLTGLRKTTELDPRPQDAWVLVKEALKRMTDRDDVMRSDRLKQVMQEMDPTFDEGAIGFSKFSKFLAEASSRGLVKLQKLENGLYEVASKSRGRHEDGDEPEPRRERGRGRGRGERREREDREERAPAASPPPVAAATREAVGDDPLRVAYGTLKRALDELREAGRDPVRDSDVKRKVLELNPSFDEAELGFPKFSRFLTQAEDHGVVRLVRTEAGNFEVSASIADRSAPPRETREAGEPREPRESPPAPAAEADRGAGETSRALPSVTTVATEAAPAPPRPTPPPPPKPTMVEIDPGDLGDTGLRLGPRRGSTRRRGPTEAPILFEGQVVVAAPPSPFAQGAFAQDAMVGGPPIATAQTGVAAYEREPAAAPPRVSDGGDLDAGALGLPTDPEAIVRYLTHRYRGVGEKTAESLVERFGPGLFRVLRDDPQAISDAVTPKRAEQVLEAWATDYERRSARAMTGGNGGEGGDGRPSERGRRPRRRGPRGRSES